jgi:organic radical activating enzyme
LTYFPERIAAAEAAAAADLVEIFSAIQGEGPRVGERHLFVRFAGCDMACVYCDTPACHVPLSHWRNERRAGGREFDRRPNPEPLTSLAEIVRGHLTSGVRHAAVSFTGGEPLLQPQAILALAPVVRAAGARTLLETDANFPEAYLRVRDAIDVLSMDWKLASATGEPTRVEAHRRILADSVGREAYVKAVFVEETPDDEVIAAACALAELRPDVPLILQPCSPSGRVKRSPSPARCLALHETALRAHSDVRVVPQVHRLMGQL